MTSARAGPVCARCTPARVTVDPHPCDDSDQHSGKELPSLPGPALLDPELAWLGYVIGQWRRRERIRGHRTRSIVAIHHVEMLFDPEVTIEERDD